MAKSNGITAEQLIKKMVSDGFRVERIVLQRDIAPCDHPGCNGVVGRVWPVSLVDFFSPDGMAVRCIIAYPCDRCGKLYSSPGAKHALQTSSDSLGVFLKGKELHFVDANGQTIRRCTNLIRCTT